MKVALKLINSQDLRVTPKVNNSSLHKITVAVVLIRGGPFDFWWGGCANPKKNIEHMFLVKKKFLAEFLRRKKKFLAEYLRRKKKSGSLNLGVAKDFAWCVTAPKLHCESHDTGLGITIFDAWFGILQARRMIDQLDFLLKWTLWSRRILWFNDIHAFRFPP